MIIDGIRAILDDMNFPYDDTIVESKDILGVVYEIPVENSDQVTLIPITIYVWPAQDDEEYIRMSVNGYIQPDGLLSDKICVEISQINNILPQAKLFVDEDGDVGIAIDLSPYEVNNQSLRRALERLARWADFLLPRLQAFLNE